MLRISILVSLSDFSIGFWNSSDSVLLFFIFYFTLILDVSIFPLSTILIFDLWIVPIVWYFVLLILLTFTENLPKKDWRKNSKITHFGKVIINQCLTLISYLYFRGSFRHWYRVDCCKFWCHLWSWYGTYQYVVKAYCNQRKHRQVFADMIRKNPKGICRQDKKNPERYLQTW